ncbi:MULTISPECIES: undecaprenyl-diphosphate phosphatase [Bacillus]|uniref:undecaprenyl-diphosphate phosphatase n=1 Tax=Bacillus TaxID=1386 RepID=UPI0007FB3F7C|nr:MULTISPECIES: undecaprenyl-diphosphate phosphatase [Bacillus]OBW56408.1 UDP pyrophosphate phosphatase [Bacillus cereus]OPA14537.1 UDP pyrophosphate phosphatase [Bacillus cereus]TKH21741.1 undecaprenyl-diphosphate phosphatase [Bacillus cereus]
MEQFYYVLKYLILGLFQGLTEPIPISSSGHLVLAQHLLGLKIEGFSFELLVNSASLLAVLLIYRNDLIRLTKNGLSYIFTRAEDAKSDFFFIIYLVIATIPAGVIGVLFKDYIDQYLKGVKMVGVSLLITAVGLWIIRNLRGRKNDGDLSIKDAIIVGLAQACALIPGISRSGATIVAAMLLGMKQETALRFSFLLYIPVSLGGLLLSITDIANDPNLDTLFVPYVVAFIATFIMTYISLKWFMNIMAKGNLKYFSFYCIIVGVLTLIFL